MEREHAEEGHAADDGIGREQVKETALIDHIRADGESRNEVRDGNAPQERGNHTADRQRARPAAFPLVVVAVMTELERHTAQDERDEHEEERDVERAEHRRIDVRKRREHRAARRDHPHLVAVPNGTDGLNDLRAVLFIL